MNNYSNETANTLTAECRSLRARARELGVTQQAIFENDECRVRITAHPDGQVGLHFNPGLLMGMFERINAEAIAEIAAERLAKEGGVS